jgi:TRAP-type C4-dicarboxylate transport system substrate-binding protein
MTRTSARRTLLATALGAAFSLPIQAQEVTLKVAHFLPPGSVAHSKFITPWCDKIAKESAGRLKCQIFPAMQLGGTPPQLIDQVRDGIADLVWTLPGYTAGRFPTMEVFELPFMTNTAESASRAAWEYYGKHAQKEFAQVKPLAFHVHDEGYVHSREKQIKVLADFKGLKMRAPTRQTNKMLAAYGATPVSMPVPALAEALSKGVVDGFCLPWEVIPTVKAHEMVKYHTETPPTSRALYTAVFVWAMNPGKYNSLPADLKKVIDANSGADVSAWIGSVWDASAPSARKQAVDRGNVFYTLPDAEVANWIKASQPLYDDYAKDMSAKGVDGKALIEDARALVRQYEKK